MELVFLHCSSHLFYEWGPPSPPLFIHFLLLSYYSPVLPGVQDFLRPWKHLEPDGQVVLPSLLSPFLSSPHFLVHICWKFLPTRSHILLSLSWLCGRNQQNYPPQSHCGRCVPTVVLVHEDGRRAWILGLAFPVFSPRQTISSLCSVRALLTMGGNVWIYVHTGHHTWL